ncbi:hypothetical protein DLM85_02875 [Hymenobacter edaphi]|uniref:Uncharacterized protein n=2 Tax=Hymenobacter edaphi TaxID=2211146 RepID=A0A328BVD4_9BACT|nr:hypothetical protein DLM85_02875 [Hymenobacter edaphi]
MRPQDVVVLLKITTLGALPWQGKDLAAALLISPAEISDALRRCRYAGLLLEDGRTVDRRALLRLLVHGLPYVFPARPGALAPGVPTAHSAVPALQGPAAALPPHVWPSPGGPLTGAAIEPLYPGAPAAALLDAALHELLAVVDALRLGHAGPQQAARDLLRTRVGQP